MSDARWAPDPSGRFEWRYWDGARWTDRVAAGGRLSEDPVPEPAALADDDPGTGRGASVSGAPGAALDLARRVVAAFGTGTGAGGPALAPAPPAIAAAPVAAAPPAVGAHPSVAAAAAAVAAPPASPAPSRVVGSARSSRSAAPPAPAGTGAAARPGRTPAGRDPERRPDAGARAAPDRRSAAAAIAATLEAASDAASQAVTEAAAEAAEAVTSRLPPKVRSRLPTSGPGSSRPEAGGGAATASGPTEPSPWGSAPELPGPIGRRLPTGTGPTVPRPTVPHGARSVITTVAFVLVLLGVGAVATWVERDGVTVEGPSVTIPDLPDLEAALPWAGEDDPGSDVVVPGPQPGDPYPTVDDMPRLRAGEALSTTLPGRVPGVWVVLLGDGERVRIVTETDGLDPDARVFDPAGQVVATDDALGDIDLVVTVEDVLVVEIFEFLDRSGELRVRLEPVAG